MHIQFLGGTGTVTGSKYLIETAGRRLLVDCGLFQGYKQLRLRNWAALPVDPAHLDAVVLTHAHLDHSGYLPLLVRNGFRAKVYCTAATRDLCAILLPDSGHLQEEETRYANERGFSKHKPALPLYTQRDAERCLPAFAPVDFRTVREIVPGIRLTLRPAGHILGSATAELLAGGTRILFSGDLGRSKDLIMQPPERIAQADYLVLESTYGDRLHQKQDPLVQLADVINRTVARKGVVLVPAFAVGRVQELLYALHLLKASERIPDLPIYLNSPMAVDATAIYHRHRQEHRLEADECKAMCTVARFINSVDESRALNCKSGPMIIISASGMATGGRILHHLKAFAPDARNTILLSGFQAGGTRGAAIASGAESVKIHGEQVPIRAEVAILGNLSAHADWAEMLDWLGGFSQKPRRVFVTHGEPNASDALRRRIEETLGWECEVPDYLERKALA